MFDLIKCLSQIPVFKFLYLNIVLQTHILVILFNIRSNVLRFFIQKRDG